MFNDAFDMLKENRSRLMSISNFLSTSSDRDVAIKFVQQFLADPMKTAVLLTIEIDPSMPTNVPVVNIDRLS